MNQNEEFSPETVDIISTEFTNYTILVKDLYIIAGITQLEEMHAYNDLTLVLKWQDLPCHSPEEIRFWNMVSSSNCLKILDHLISLHPGMTRESYFQKTEERTNEGNWIYLDREFFLDQLGQIPLVDYKVLPINPSYYQLQTEYYDESITLDDRTKSIGGLLDALKNGKSGNIYEALIYESESNKLFHSTTDQDDEY